MSRLAKAKRGGTATAPTEKGVMKMMTLLARLVLWQIARVNHRTLRELKIALALYNVKRKRWGTTNETTEPSKN